MTLPSFVSFSLCPCGSADVRRSASRAQHCVRQWGMWSTTPHALVDSRSDWPQWPAGVLPASAPRLSHARTGAWLSSPPIDPARRRPTQPRLGKTIDLKARSATRLPVSSSDLPLPSPPLLSPTRTGGLLMGNEMATSAGSTGASASASAAAATQGLRKARDAVSRVLSAAADADEKGRTAEAVAMYREGLSLVSRALQGLRLGSGDEWADARRIAAQMQRNRDTVDDIIQKRTGEGGSEGGERSQAGRAGWRAVGAAVEGMGMGMGDPKRCKEATRQRRRCIACFLFSHFSFFPSSSSPLLPCAAPVRLTT